MRSPIILDDVLSSRLISSPLYLLDCCGISDGGGAVVVTSTAWARDLAQLLVAAGESMIDVPPKLASRVRVYSTGHGNKTDDTDAVPVARAALHSRNLRKPTTRRSG